MTVFERHDAEAADHHARAVWTLYDAVFGDTADQASWRTDLWDRHRARDGFRLVTAYDEGSSGTSGLLGFGWACLGERGQYWSDRVVAVRLYRSRGWTTVGLLGEGVQVMGLPADRAEQGVPPHDPAPR